MTVATRPDDVRFKRRRYGNTTYTWAYLVINATWHELGDPWPGVTWKKSVLQKAVAEKKKELEHAV